MNCCTIEKVVLKSATKETAASFERVENARQENVAQHCRGNAGNTAMESQKEPLPPLISCISTLQAENDPVGLY